VELDERKKDDSDGVVLILFEESFVCRIEKRRKVLFEWGLGRRENKDSDSDSIISL